MLTSQRLHNPINFLLRGGIVIQGSEEHYYEYLYNSSSLEISAFYFPCGSVIKRGKSTQHMLLS